MFMVIQQATLIGYINDLVHNHLITVNYKETRSPSQKKSTQMQEHVLQACLLTLLKLERIFFKRVFFKIMIPKTSEFKQ